MSAPKRGGSQGSVDSGSTPDAPNGEQAASAATPASVQRSHHGIKLETVVQETMASDSLAEMRRGDRVRDKEVLSQLFDVFASEYEQEHASRRPVTRQIRTPGSMASAPEPTRYMSVSRLELLLQSTGRVLPEAELRRRSLEAENAFTEGKLSLLELCTIAYDLDKPTDISSEWIFPSRRAVRDALKGYDYDDSGKISGSHIRHVISKLGSTEALTSQEAQRIVDHFGVPDGKKGSTEKIINTDEFISLIQDVICMPPMHAQPHP